MNVLITGGNGYIATSIFKALKDYHSITQATRQELDLLNPSAVNQWFSDKQFDMVIHTAITGGSRLHPENIAVMDNNLRMYYNLLDNQNKFDRFISIGSGAELYHTHSPYGLSKHVIRKSILEKNNFYNIRVFALFDEDELNTRFIKANIKNYIEKKPIMIHQNKYMDFFYMQDFIKLIQAYIENFDVPKEIDCTYKESHTLLDIAHKINTLSDYTVDINIQFDGMADSYVGTYTPSSLEYNELTFGIQTVYEKLCKI